MRGRELEVLVKTAAKQALVNVSEQLARAVAESGVSTGIACASVPHTTCALLINEDEEGLREDILRLSGEVIEPLRRKAPFAHDRIDNNAAAHLTSLFFHPSVTVPISGGKPLLGTWQSLFLLELDGPRTRTVRFTITGE